MMYGWVYDARIHTCYALLFVSTIDNAIILRLHGISIIAFRTALGTLVLCGVEDVLVCFFPFLKKGLAGEQGILAVEH